MRYFEEMRNVAGIVLGLRPSDPELGHAGAERARIHVQHERCAPGPADTPARGLESSLDRRALRLPEGLNITGRAWVGSVRERFGDLHDGSPGEDTGTLEHILQFPNVPRPMIFLQARKRFI